MNRLKAAIAEFVGNYTRRRGYPPTVEELITSFGNFKIMVAMFYVVYAQQPADFSADVFA